MNSGDKVLFRSPAKFGKNIFEVGIVLSKKKTSKGYRYDVKNEIGSVFHGLSTNKNDNGYIDKYLSTKVVPKLNNTNLSKTHDNIRS